MVSETGEIKPTNKRKSLGNIDILVKSRNPGEISMETDTVRGPGPEFLGTVGR